VESAKQLGLVPGIKIGSGVIDAYAGWVGSVGAKVDIFEKSIDTEDAENSVEQAFHRIAVVAGTSTCHLVMSKEPVFAPGIWGPYRDVLLEGRWLAEVLFPPSYLLTSYHSHTGCLKKGGQSTTGALLHNVLTTHPSYSSALGQARSVSLSIFDFLNGHLSALRTSQKAPSIGYLARHLFFYGDKHGNRSPIADPNMRGAIVGLSMDSSIDDLALQYYSAVEFIAQQTRHIIDVLNKSGHSVTGIFMSGGQCKNPLLVELIADAAGLPVAIPRYIQDAVVLGAAMLGAKAASANEKGETEDLWSIMDRMSQGGRVVYPTSDVNVKRLLEAKYEVNIYFHRLQANYNC